MFSVRKASNIFKNFRKVGFFAILLTATTSQAFAQNSEVTIKKTLTKGQTYTHNQYAVPYVQLDLTYSYEEHIDTDEDGNKIYARGEAHAMVTCGDGSWNVSIPDNETQLCMDQVTIPCYYKPGKNCTTTIRKDTFQANDVKLINNFKCSGTACGYLSKNNENSYTETSNIVIDSANQKQDRFRIKNGQTGFFEYNYANKKKLIFIDARKKNDSTKNGQSYLIPWGPLSKFNKREPNEDFEDFINNNSETSESPLKVYYACPPVTISLCGSTNTNDFKRVDGQCGNAHGGDFANRTQLKEADLCRLGRPSSVSGPSSSNKFTWTCRGAGVGKKTASCSADFSQDGKCGPAHNKEYASSDKITTGQCDVGTPSALQGPTRGPWLWTCKGVGSGDASETCIGNNKYYKCGPVKDVIYIMDDSGSMSGNRITIARNSMKETVKKQIAHKQKFDTTLTKIGIMGLNRTNSTSDSSLWMNYIGGGLKGFSEAGAAATTETNAINRINSFTASGGTPLWDRVISAANKLGSGDNNYANYIIAFSDGESSGTASSALAALNKYSNLHMHAVDLNNSSSFRDVALDSGGLYAKASNQNELSALIQFFAIGCD